MEKILIAGGDMRQVYCGRRLAEQYEVSVIGFDGDMLVMLSDGIGEAEYPYISQLLREQTEPEEIVRSACDKCTLFHGGQSRDDVTVIAARMTSRIRADYTKIDKPDSVPCDDFSPALSKAL